METNKLIVGVVLAAVVVIMIAGLMIPAIDNAADDIRGYKTYYNSEEIAPYTEVKAGDHVYWSPTGITVNDEVIDGNRTAENWFKSETFLGADGMFFVLKQDNSIANVSGLLYVDMTINNDMTITYVYENQDTGGVPQTRTSAPISWGFVVANEGDWCQVKYDSQNTKVYFNSVDQVYTSGPAGGITSSKGTTAYYKGVEYADGVEFNGIEQVGNDAYMMNFDLDSMEYVFEGHAADDIRVVVVPLKVSTTPIDNPSADVIEIIPLLILVALLLSAVAFFIIRRE